MQKVNPLSGTSTVVVYQAVFNGNIGELTGTSSFKPDSVVEPFNFHVFMVTLSPCYVMLPIVNSGAIRIIINTVYEVPVPINHQ